MADTPDEIIEAYLVDVLRAIRVANGYRTNVFTVDFGDRRDALLSTDCPAVLISTGADRADGETFGGQSGNAFSRLWTWDLDLIPGDAQDFRRAGYDLKADVMKALLANQCAPDGKQPWGISIDTVDPVKFERAENKAAPFKMSITVKYQITLGDL